MLVQDFLRYRTGEMQQDDVSALGALTDGLGIRTTFHPTDPLVILNYDQIESPKHDPRVQECRGLTLEMGTWDVVARSFPRFFNHGECPEQDKKFDWGNFTADSKEDGSLMLLYRYKDQWRVNTRGSFALGEIGPSSGKIWEQVFFEALDEVGLDWMAHIAGAADRTLVFELCSPYNKVVRRYETPTLFLLTAFMNKSGYECHDISLDRWAEVMRVKRPVSYSYRVTNLQQCINFLEGHDDATFEGLVLRDRHGMRLKVKNSRYVALHHLKDNGNIFNPKNLLPLVLKGEISELMLHFPEVTGNYLNMVEQLEGKKARMLAVWEGAKHLESQKAFALFVTKHTELASILFAARKKGVEPDTLWNESQDILLKHLKDKPCGPYSSLAA